MKFLPIHTEALRNFGYTEEEARFLYLVATHSGYFTCQQFLQFIETKPGKRSVAFAQKVLKRKHASAKEYLRHGRVLHLFSRNLYEAIGRENVRFRRIHSTEYIRTRLIALDFILRNQNFTYLETEEQKLTFFCDQVGINKKSFPTNGIPALSRATSLTAIAWISFRCFTTQVSQLPLRSHSVSSIRGLRAWTVSEPIWTPI